MVGTELKTYFQGQF